MKVLYGYDTEHYDDVTQIVRDTYSVRNQFVIPRTDSVRAQMFGDNYKGHLKHIRILRDDGTSYILDNTVHAYISLETGELIKTGNVCYEVLHHIATNTSLSAEKRLAIIQNSVLFYHGSMSDEYPEQLMTMLHLRPSAKVLEIGGECWTQYYDYFNNS